MKKKIIGIFVCMLLFSTCLSIFVDTGESSEVVWWDSDWDYRRLITIDSSSVDLDLDNFPVLIYISSDYCSLADFDNDGDVDMDDYNIFDQCYNGAERPPNTNCSPGVDADFDDDGDVDNDDFAIFAACYGKVAYPSLAEHAQDDGDDIAFVLYNDNTMQLNHEIEYFNDVTGELIAWVNVPNLSSTVDTKIWMYFGNSASSRQENPTGVWDSNYHGVWHLDETSGSVDDLTSNNNDGIEYISPNSNMDVIGKIDGADYFDGVNDYITVPDVDSLNMSTGDFTIEAWVKTQETNTRWIIAKYSPNMAPTSQMGYVVKITDGKLDAILADGTKHELDDGIKTINDDAWHHLVVVFDRDNKGTYYVDGVVDKETDISGWIGDTNNELNFEIGREEEYLLEHESDYFFNGIIDEARISNIARSAAWIKTTYNTMMNPDTFLSFGSTETLSQLVISTSSAVTEGETFEVVVTADDNPVENAAIEFLDDTYLTDANGKAILTAPQIEADTDMLISAYKNGYESTQVWITIRDIRPEMGQLVISTVSTLFEGMTFTVTITDDLTGDVVANADVTFNEETLQTDSLGNVTFLAPDVSQDIGYTITASKENYEPAIIAITVLNQDEPQIDTGWISGTVSDTTGFFLEKVAICVIISQVNGFYTTQCTFTDVNGEYTVLAPIGTYTLEASLSSYVTGIVTDVQVTGDETTMVNFMLTEGTDGQEGVIPPVVDENRDEVQEAIEDGKVGGEIIVNRVDDEEYESFVLSYSDVVTIDPISIKKGSISLLVNGDENSTGKTLVVNVDKNFFDKNSELTIEYDGENIAMADNIEDILNPNDDGLHAEYLITSGGEGTQVLLSIPHFSEHTITISSVVEALGGIIAVTLYIAFCAVAGIMFLSHALSGPVIRFIIKRKKR